jgi:hypothetical protein
MIGCIIRHSWPKIGRKKFSDYHQQKGDIQKWSYDHIVTILKLGGGGGLYCEKTD